MLVDTVAVQSHPMAQFQNQGHGKLGHGGSSVAGNIAHGDVTLSGGFAIYHVVTCSKDAN